MQNRTLFYGEGIFETILWRGRSSKLLRHYKRLKNSADFFKIPCPDYEEFCQKIEKKTKGKKNLYVKFCLFSKGESAYYQYPQKSESVVVVKKLQNSYEAQKICLSSIKRHSNNVVIYHKTMNYLPNILAKREALIKGFDDGIFLNENEQITECTSSNLLIVKNDKLLTPARDSGLLLGTTMEILIDKMNVKEEYIKIDDLYKASCLFITNSIVEVIPVAQFMNVKYPLDVDILQTIKKTIQEENPF